MSRLHWTDIETCVWMCVCNGFVADWRRRWESCRSSAFMGGASDRLACW